MISFDHGHDYWQSHENGDSIYRVYFFKFEFINRFNEFVDIRQKEIQDGWFDEQDNDQKIMS